MDIETKHLTLEDRQFFVQIIGQYKEQIELLTSTIPPTDLLVFTAYLLGMLETQMPEATEAFDTDLRPFFKEFYPNLMASVAAKFGPPKADGFVVIVPEPAPEEKRVVNPFDPNPVLPEQSRLVS